MNCVMIESPYAGDVETHVRYARRCLKDSLLRDEAPFASHLLYTQDGVLDDQNPDERRRGIDAGHSWICFGADLVAVYTDYGVSQGMAKGISAGIEAGVAIEFRSIGRNPS